MFLFINWLWAKTIKADLFRVFMTKIVRISKASKAGRVIASSIKISCIEVLMSLLALLGSTVL